MYWIYLLPISLLSTSGLIWLNTWLFHKDLMILCHPKSYILLEIFQGILGVRSKIWRWTHVVLSYIYVDWYCTSKIIETNRSHWRSWRCSLPWICLRPIFSFCSFFLSLPLFPGNNFLIWIFPMLSLPHILRNSREGWYNAIWSHHGFQLAYVLQELLLKVYQGLYLYGEDIFWRRK